MDKKWTAAQRAAMETRSKTLLVSAAAGSGKTATLTERIILSLTDPQINADISKMLIVTFTRAAANELKKRIFSALSKALANDPSNKHLTSQLMKLGSANICTIDSFYLDLVRSNFSVLGLPASFRIADTVELELLSRSVMEDIIDHFYETDEDFPSFAECFTATRSSDKLCDTLLDIASRSASVPEGIDFLRESSERVNTEAMAGLDFLSTSFGAVLRARSIDTVEHALSVFEAACEYISDDENISSAMLASFEYDRNFCVDLLDALKDNTHGYSLAKARFESFSPIRLGRLKSEFITEKSELFKEARKKLLAQLRDLGKKSFSKSEEVIQRAMLDTARYTEKLYLLLKAFEETMSKEKLRRSLLDFNDIRRYTFRLLVENDGTPTAIARQYAERFSEIYIDEYQDVDRVQDLIFRCISRNDNRFMVGDIKQSIYSFRGAEPQVFADYRAEFPSYKDALAQSSDSATIFMSENFRCDKNVIDFTNLICSRIFSACSESIGYRKDDDLVFSKGEPSDTYVSPKVQVSVILSDSTQPDDESIDDENDESNDKTEKQNIKESEALYIAQEISRLIREEKKADGSAILPEDIAVLFRSRSMSAYVASALNELGIKTSESDGDKYFEDPDVLMVLCILNAVDNPHRDIFLTGAMRSPIFGFTMDDIIRIRKASDPSFSLYDALLAYADSDSDPILAAHCRELSNILISWQRDSAHLPVDRFLRMLFESEIFISAGISGAASDSSDSTNLTYLYEYARTFESGSFKGLYNFIEFINSVIEEGKKMKLPPKGSSPDRVNLMTIHQSKGLEFPVCFICGCASKFNRRDTQESLMFEYGAGVAMKISDSTGFARINTPMREALVMNGAIKQSEEEMRVLYVALTRARERLYVTASSSSDQEKIMRRACERAMFCDRHTLLSCNSYIDWILIPFADDKCDTSCSQLSFISASTLSSSVEIISDTSQVPQNESERNEELYQLLKERFSFSYPYSDLRRIPAKISVSRLSPDVLDESDDSVDIFPTRPKSSVPDFFISGKVSKAGAAERGTATHLFLQFCDIGYASRNGVAKEIERLVEKRFIPQNIADLIYTDELESFLSSELADIIKDSRRVIREQRFNLLLSPENFTQDDNFHKILESESLAVQGVIDLILIGKDGSISLFDYKTDRLSRAALLNDDIAKAELERSHALQLSYYAHAVRLLFGRPCDRVCIYSTHSAKLYDIEPRPLIVDKEIIDIL